MCVFVFNVQAYVFSCNLLPTGSEKRGVLGVGNIPVAILPSCHNMKLLHHNCKNIEKVG